MVHDSYGQQLGQKDRRGYGTRLVRSAIGTEGQKGLWYTTRTVGNSTHRRTLNYRARNINLINLLINID